MTTVWTRRPVRRVALCSTTAAVFGSRLWLVNARFGTPPGPDVAYETVAVRR